MTDRYLSDEQREVLLSRIRPGRVKKTDGHANLQTWDVIAYLTRIFGFMGWDKEIRDVHLVFESPAVKNAHNWDVAYSAVCKLTIMGMTVHEDVAVGSAQNQPNRGEAHHLAATSAVSTALKRAAKDLGDQFGLSLYNKGSLEPVVGKTLGGDKNPFARILGEGDTSLQGTELDPERPFE